MYYLGYDLGSSSVKAALIDASNNCVIHSTSYPDHEMHIDSSNANWAEQNPEDWWKNVIEVTGRLIKESDADIQNIKGIGITYQMHGLVVVDKNKRVLRPAIIWCDSRAVSIGDNAYRAIGAARCNQHLLNSPGNFTASKLAWIKENEPDVFSEIDKVMLPGDYLALKLTGAVKTTVNGLSEGIFWDFVQHQPADFLLKHLRFNPELIPEITDNFVEQGRVSTEAAEQLGIPDGIPLLYRAGDQPNNAMSLGVLEPGEIAASGGTSGVVYGITDQLVYDETHRINSFAHVNHKKDKNRIGVLLCINASGILYRWVRENVLGSEVSYPEMEAMARKSEVGARGLYFLPFGNGGERMLNFKNKGAQLFGLNLNLHNQSDVIRASLEGIAFSFVYGIELIESIGVPVKRIKVANDNLFQSEIFSQVIANLSGVEIEMYETTGAVGAAQGASYAGGAYDSLEKAIFTKSSLKTFKPENAISPYQKAYSEWKKHLEISLNQS